MKRIVQPEGWSRPRGFSHAVEATGRQIHVAGQIGTDADGTFVGPDLVAQAGQALKNIVNVLAAADAAPTDLVRMTWFVTDIDEYRRNQDTLGAAYRAVMGRYYPAMTLVAVTALVEPRARVEIEATAVVMEENEA